MSTYFGCFQNITFSFFSIFSIFSIFVLFFSIFNCFELFNWISFQLKVLKLFYLFLVSHIFFIPAKQFFCHSWRHSMWQFDGRVPETTEHRVNAAFEEDFMRFEHTIAEWEWPIGNWAPVFLCSWIRFLGISTFN